MPFHPSAERIAKRFHEEYERLAPAYGWNTQTESRKPWSEVPEQNKNLMKGVVSVLLYEEDIYVGNETEEPPEQYTWGKAMEQFKDDRA